MNSAAHKGWDRPDPAMLDRWRDLADNSSEPNPFYHPALLLPALANLDAGAQVRMIEACDGRDLIGLMPMLVKAHHARYAVRNATNWMHGQCFFGAPLLRKGVEKQAWAGLLAQLDGVETAGHFLHLDALWLDGPITTALLQYCEESGRAIKLIARHERALLQSDLSADTYWETHVRAKKRKEIRRLANRLSDLGTISHSRLDPGDDVAAWTEEFIALESTGWKGAHGTALGSRDETRRFFREALPNAAQAGMLDMVRIDLDGAAVAMLVNFRLGGGAFSYKIAYDEKFARYSPGVLIEIDNLRATLADPTIDWMDSCAAPDHPMIDGIWAERRTIGQFRVALNGRGLNGLKRRAVFAATGLAEHAIGRIKGTAG